MLVHVPARQIASESWEEFFRRFTELHRGTPVTVEQIESEKEVDLFREVPLQRVEFERTEGCSDLIHIEVGASGQKGQIHTLTEPLHVKLYQDENGSKLLRIDSENGIVLVRFRSGKLEELIDGLKVAILAN